ncbi:MAG TPA: hypothetical protein VHU88_20205 [Sporichthyaceae bacterium]|nr:hypothetical protein [Sporichthyaceae bacterium]
MIDEPAANGLAVHVLDALWSADDLGKGESDAVVELYRELREQDWGDADTDGIAELTAQIEALGGPAGWANLIRKRLPGASTRVEVLRATAVVEACELLIGADLHSPADFRAANAETVGHLERSWKRMAGQRSGKSFRRLLALCGADGRP